VKQKLITITVKAIEEQKQQESASAAQAAAAAQAGAAVGAGATVISTTISGNPPTGIWAIIHQLQYILLLLMIDDFTPDEIDAYIEAQSDSLLSFSFLPFDSFPGVNIPIDWMYFEQPNQKLELLEIESRSTFINIFSILCLFLVILGVHLVLLVLPK
jgi:hypothetical protein